MYIKLHWHYYVDAVLLENAKHRQYFNAEAMSSIKNIRCLLTLNQVKASLSDMK